MGRSAIFIPSPDKRLGNSYELLECLGDGSYGWVWRSRRLKDGQIVALKIPKAQGAKNEDLIEGAALVGVPAHPHVIEIYWVGRVPPQREWFVIEMEYFPSVTLAQLLDNGEAGFVTSYRRLLELYDQLLSGIEHLHSLDISHGDIKPHNILVSGDQVKVSDFGCSILPEEMYARTRENGGTLLYSAPETTGVAGFRGTQRDFFAADIYSLGVLLYHLLTARLPHNTLSQVARHAPFPRPTEINTSICPQLEAFILRCLEGETHCRWASCAAMRQAFSAAFRAQLEYSPVRRSSTIVGDSVEDCSTQAAVVLDEEDLTQVEHVAAAEIGNNKEHQAFLSLIASLMRQKRYFDCLRTIEERGDLLQKQDAMADAVRRIAVDGYLAVRNIDKAQHLLKDLLVRHGEAPALRLKMASILALQADYQGASELLLHLNREYPQRPSILKRLVAIHEQMRDTGKALAFWRAYERLAPEDPWVCQKRKEFSAVGLL